MCIYYTIYKIYSIIIGDSETIEQFALIISILYKTLQVASFGL